MCILYSTYRESACSSIIDKINLEISFYGMFVPVICQVHTHRFWFWILFYFFVFNLLFVRSVHTIAQHVRLFFSQHTTPCLVSSWSILLAHDKRKTHRNTNQTTNRQSDMQIDTDRDGRWDRKRTTKNSIHTQKNYIFPNQIICIHVNDNERSEAHRTIAQIICLTIVLFHAR